MLTIVLQQGINGIVFGSLYVLVALGLTLIYGVLVQINFAHADIVTIGAFAAYFFTFLFGGNYLVSIGIALMVRGAGLARQRDDLRTVARTWQRIVAADRDHRRVDPVAERDAALVWADPLCLR